jgi:hypothetical protein
VARKIVEYDIGAGTYHRVGGAHPTVLNNYRYWNFHPYPQRTFLAELKYDL